jgi:DNA-binding transcriptional MerR regulator
LERIKQIQKLSKQGIPLEKIKQLLSREKSQTSTLAVLVPSASSDKKAFSAETPLANCLLAFGALPPVQQPEMQHFIRFNVTPEIEISFRPGALSLEDRHAIEEFIIARLRR